VFVVAVSAALRDALRARLGSRTRTHVLAGSEVLERFGPASSVTDSRCLQNR
jgi:hypothetical protein